MNLSATRSARKIDFTFIFPSKSKPPTTSFSNGPYQQRPPPPSTRSSLPTYSIYGYCPHPVPTYFHHAPHRFLADRRRHGAVRPRDLQQPARRVAGLLQDRLRAGGVRRAVQVDRSQGRGHLLSGLLFGGGRECFADVLRRR